MRNGEGIVVAGGVRTAIGKFAGAFKDTPSSDLGANAIRAAVERAGISPEVVDEVILGCVGQVGEDAFNARLATLKAGLPEKTTAFNVNRLCGSGLQAINSAVQELRTGEDQIVPVAIPQKKGDPVIARVDEHPRPGTTVESLGRLKPAFREGGSVTAGNSSGINDAGAAVVVMTRAKAGELGVTPQLEWVADAVAGIAPEIMGVAPIFAVQNLLKKVGMTINDIDLMELNEAFAAQAVAVIRELEIDPEKVNPNGGAIALGHPVGATGAILTVKLAYELKRRQAEWGIVTMCIGGGQGIATLFRNLN